MAEDRLLERFAGHFKEFEGIFSPQLPAFHGVNENPQSRFEA
jgi:hypothetical protein